ncbi:glycosyltransferase family 4 protein [Arthrobacter sp. MSA 4-2]|uniref:glycosyltransferase family 4 protein n=1 Tax=Arthrobacter sp. MSA 4-2 TaxID=2794349 RepID=UPI001E3AAD72|nr:glycosyltransferase family 4 protein [Arthrobacter sp. MSA 4-2]
MKYFQGKRVLVLNWRDIEHSQAGGAEQYMHQISKRWVDAGIDVTWYTSRDSHQDPADTIDGVHIVRGGGALTLYPQAALGLLRTRPQIDAVVDCQNGIPFFSPLFVTRKTPVVQVVHHVHQKQFRTHFSPPVAALGRYLEGNAARRIYGPRAIAAVSPSTRMELRNLGYQGPIHIVPNGTGTVPNVVGPRDPDPTITIVSRLVAHKRIDILIGQIAAAATQYPNLRAEIVGDGPERARLEQIVMDLGMYSNFTFHGYQPDAVRDALLNRAWLTLSASDAEGWGCSIIEAAAWGVPCIALRAPGIRDSVMDGQTGWLVDSVKELGAALIERLGELSDPGTRSALSQACQQWARCFNWDRSAALLAGVLMEESLETPRLGARSRREVHRDMSTVAQFDLPQGLDLSALLTGTDEFAEIEGTTVALLKGRDEFEASVTLKHLGVEDAVLWPATRSDLLAGPERALSVEGLWRR